MGKTTNQYHKYVMKELSTWSRILLQKQTVAKLFSNYPPFVELKSSLLCSQEPATGPNYLQPLESSVYPHILFL
jgi:hypothetical protein